MIEIRLAKLSDFESIQLFYQEAIPGYSISKDDEFFVSIESDQIVGVVRRAVENGFLLLRGMQIAPTHQRKQLGTQLLQMFEKNIKGRECYCLPYAHLESFYGLIGFKKIETKEAPEFLQERLQKYLELSNSIIMYRVSD